MRANARSFWALLLVLSAWSGPAESQGRPVEGKSAPGSEIDKAVGRRDGTSEQDKRRDEAVKKSVPEGPPKKPAAEVVGEEVRGAGRPKPVEISDPHPIEIPAPKVKLKPQYEQPAAQPRTADRIREVIDRAGPTSQDGTLGTVADVKSHLLEKYPDMTDAEQVARSFDFHEPALLVRFSKNVKLQRLYGGAARPLGRYFLCCIAEEAGGARSLDARGLALPSTSLPEALADVEIPAGTVAIVGRIADLEGAKGGGVQFFIPRTQGFRYESFPFVRERTDPTDIVVYADERGDVVLRARVADGKPATAAAESSTRNHGATKANSRGQSMPQATAPAPAP